jgi:hypothetical protein
VNKEFTVWAERTETWGGALALLNIPDRFYIEPVEKIQQSSRDMNERRVSFLCEQLLN